MTAWAFILVPLAVLPIVLLFRFIGCGFDGKATGNFFTDPEPPPPYAKTIRTETSVIAYWRLVDGTAPIATDEKAFQDGDYVEGLGLPPEAPPTFNPGSEAATGGFLFSSQPGLIASNPTAKCRFFIGGHVRVPFKQGLYTEEFTIEAWIEKGWQQKPFFEHVLFSAGGHYQAPQADSKKNHGFMVFANGDGRWEVQFFTDDGVVSLPPMPLPIVPDGKPTHIAVILKNDIASFPFKNWYIYFDGKPIGPGTVKSYSLPDGAPLFIGVGGRSNDSNDPNPTPRFPMLSRIQEVVLHNRALSQEEIQNHVKLNR